MSYMAWDAGRVVRDTLEHEYSVRVLVKCRCGRSLGTLYGDDEVPWRRYLKGRVPQIIFTNATANFDCHRRCGANYSPNVDTLRAAYRMAAAKPERVLVMPYDLKPVPRRQPAVRFDGAFIGSGGAVAGKHRP